MTTYDLTTARGVLLALADGHTLISKTGAVLYADDNYVVADGGTRIALTTPRLRYEIAPKVIDTMDVPELARELYGDASCEGVTGGWPAVFVGGRVVISEGSRAQLVTRLRCLVRAKRAGEL